MKQSILDLNQRRLPAQLALGAPLLILATMFAGCSDKQTPAKPSAAGTTASAPANSTTPVTAAQKPADPQAAKPVEPKAEVHALPAATDQKSAPATTNAKIETKDANPAAAAKPAEHSADDGHNHGAEPQPAKAGAVAGPPARLDTDSTDHDFGTAIEGEHLTHTFKLKSSGPGDLHITNAKPTCGCTIAKLEVLKKDGSAELYKYGDPLPQGTELNLTAQLDTKNKHNIASSKINVYCDDPRTLVTLGLNAKVDTYFVITPNALQFNEMSVADTAEQSFQVSGKKPTGFKLTLDNKQLPDGMKIDLQPIEPGADGKATRWDVKVKLGPNCKEGNLGFPVQLRSDEAVAGAAPDKDGQASTYGASVMVTARIQGLISWDPQYLSFGLVRPGQVVARSLTVKSFDQNFTFKDPKVKIVGPSDAKPEFAYGDSFAYTIKPSEDNKSVTVELTLNGLPESVDGSFQGRLVLETGHPARPEVPVLFSGVCRPGVKAAVPAQPDPVKPAGGR